ncbi:solute carrier family 13 member 5-like [Tetranychus urticae]|uniref:solute carrier family 13 member 5-like n=1 Tax=Tetranychus urticae TaxID=32264 RepID=UPI000D645FF9|nr:solute carrier family 13 member 5-like [Tetranychus urticae]
MPLYQKCSCEETDNPKSFNLFSLFCFPFLTDRTLKSGLPKTWNNQQTNDNQDGDSSVLQSSSNPTSESKIAQLRKIMYISISSSANVGTTTTLTSGGPNLVLAYVLDEWYHERTSVDYLNWLMFAAPGSLLTILLNWIIFKYLYLRKHKVSKTNSKANNVLQEKYKQLGTLS